MSSWRADQPGVMPLPTGRLVRGRGLRKPLGNTALPEFGLYLLPEPLAEFSWPSRWVCWPDFGLPADRADARDAVQEAWRRAADERVEVACVGGRGRTGTALACLAILDGVPADEAVAYVRARYDPRAVETWRQRRFVRQFSGS